ncbi:ESPR domain-containing protein [Megasphaera elsdenii]|uniref:ESPR domain-containing protein n=1 Tax=Megasphaera elsdenii TaxID=907 RepID=UPI001F0D6F07|nr:ESPR domain-containing protein [Megasphaera elsdenii]
MNRIFKVIWSKTRNCYVVASELAKGRTKATSTGDKAKRLALAAITASCSSRSEDIATRQISALEQLQLMIALASRQLFLLEIKQLLKLLKRQLNRRCLTTPNKLVFCKMLCRMWKKN